MHLLLIGVNHRTAGLDQREALAFTRAEQVTALESVTAAGSAEALVLATCNRTEFYLVDADPAEGDRRVRAAVAALRGADLLAPGPLRYTAADADAARHLCRVAAGLDSMVLGDLQILGQVKDAVALARTAGAVGPLLDRLVDCALRAGKRARSETAVSGGIVSVASAAVALLDEELQGIQGRRLLVIGAGETARLLVRQLGSHRPADLVVANRTLASAASLAATVNGRAIGLPEIARALGEADAVVTATRAASPVISAAAVEAAMASRSGTRLVVVDLAMPRDVEPAAAAVPGVRLHAIDSIQQAVDRTLSRRLAEVPRVELLVDDELSRFETWRRGRAATPTVRALRAHFEQVRIEELARLKHLSADERARLERLTQTLVNRLLHAPTVSLKNADPLSEAGQVRLTAARDLFALDRPSRRGATDER